MNLIVVTDVDAEDDQEQESERDPAIEQGRHREAGDAGGLRGGHREKLNDRSRK